MENAKWQIQLKNEKNEIMDTNKNNTMKPLKIKHGKWKTWTNGKLKNEGMEIKQNENGNEHKKMEHGNWKWKWKWTNENGKWNIEKWNKWNKWEMEHGEMKKWKNGEWVNEQWETWKCKMKNDKHINMYKWKMENGKMKNVKTKKRQTMENGNMKNERVKMGNWKCKWNKWNMQK